MNEKSTKSYDFLFSVAPMMDWTDRHCRVFHRLMTPARAALHGDADDRRHHSWRPQAAAWLRSERASGGAAARRVRSGDLATAARIGEDFGYDEINLNVGCPSDRVKDGRFGACLMAEPALVADGVAAMKRAVKIPVTVKCRIGIDDQDPEIALDVLARGVVAAGADALVVHARKAWLNGLSPKENRDIPPLDYDRVYRLKAALPDVPDHHQWRHRQHCGGEATPRPCRRRDAGAGGLSGAVAIARRSIRNCSARRHHTPP